MYSRIVCHDRDKQFTLECHWLKPACILRSQGWYRLRLVTALLVCSYYGQSYSNESG